VCKAEDYEEHGVGAGEEGVKDEEEEVFVVSNSDAIIDPGAVVVHFDYASFADTAMMGPIRLVGITTSTQSFFISCGTRFHVIIELGIKIIGYWLRVGWYRTWICTHGLQV